jgi:hypothetical protein
MTVTRRLSAAIDITRDDRIHTAPSGPPEQEFLGTGCWPPSSDSESVARGRRPACRSTPTGVGAGSCTCDNAHPHDQTRSIGVPQAHGPLTALLLMQLLRANSTGAVASFHFRSQAPLYDLAPFRLQGIASDGHVDLQAIGPDARTAMVATAKLA